MCLSCTLLPTITTSSGNEGFCLKGESAKDCRLFQIKLRGCTLSSLRIAEAETVSNRIGLHLAQLGKAEQ
jgi:hypothetical protein